MARLNFVLAIAASLALLMPAAAFAQQPAPGRYVTGGGWGSLAIQPNGDFSLEASGVNGHMCRLEGRIAGGKAALEEGCVVNFDVQGDVIRVTAGHSNGNESACRIYCGMRASFEGSYGPEPAACRTEAIKAQRESFLGEYKARRYPVAAGRLERLLDACGNYLGWMEEAEVRNDLALAQHRAGRTPACLATLKPLERLFQYVERYPPVEREWADGMLPKIKFNWDLCGGPPLPPLPPPWPR